MPELINRMEAAGYPAYWPRMYTVPHSEAGEVLLKRFGAPDGFSSIIGAHHGKPQEKDFDAETRWINHAHLLTGRPQDEAVWRGAQHALVRWAEAEAGLSLTDLPVLPQSSQALLCGLLIMADWIASNTLYFPLLSMDDNGSSVDTESRFRRAMERLSLPPCWQTSADPSWAEGIYNLRFGTGEMLFTPYPAQSEIARIAADIETPGLMILEAPMGSGKTESALAAAELLASHVGSGGIFFGLPTQATANALFGRLKDWAERQSEDVVNTINLSHRMATLNLDYRDLLEGAALVGEESGLEVHSFFQGKKTALLSNFVVGTVDQLLMAALRRKHVMLRQLGLSGKVVIIDEVHAYDAYMSQYLQRTLQWLGAWRTPVILLSATLPASTREKLMDAYLGGAKKRDAGAAWRKSMDYPLLTWSDGGHVFQRRLTPDGRETTVQTAVISDADRLPLLREWLSEGGCAGVICNTVARAQDLAMEARQAMPDTEVMICHAQFVMPQRAKIEDELKTRLGRNGKRPSKLLLVGTQVIEQSLDIDMDLLITDLCPMDMLLQRIGRLHRHARIRPERLRAARCFVTAAEDDALIKNPIYEGYLLRRTLAILPEKLTVPTDIAPLVQCVYGDALPEDASEALIAAKERMIFNIKEQENRAKPYRIQEPVCASKRHPATLHGLLDAEADVDDARAEASVRDGGTSVEVLLLRRAGERRAGPAWDDKTPWTVPLDRIPCAEEAIAISRQRLRLPWSLCAPRNVDATIATLERQTALTVREWAQSHWLKGELVLLLDEDGTAKLNDFILRYDARYGLICEREGR